MRELIKVAVIGSRGLLIKDLGKYLPPETTEIVSGGAKGVDTSAREHADLVLAFWDGRSQGTKFVIDHCKKRGFPVRVLLPDS